MNILITGASGAIGTAITKIFAKKEHKLFLQYNKNLPTLIPQNATAIKCDLRNENEVIALFEQIKFADIVVNNAGISSFSLLQDLSLEEWNNMFAVNLTSAFLCSKLAIPHMVRQKFGHIINISSIWGEVGASCEVCYSASKSGLIGFTKALAKELAPSNILVNCVSPGLIESPMNSHLSEDDIKAFEEEIPLQRQGKAEEVAKIVEFLAEKNSYITGTDIAVNGGL